MFEIIVGLSIFLIGFSGFLAFKWYQKKSAEDEELAEKEKFIPTTQDQLAIDYIRGGVVKLKSGGYRVLVELPSVNIELMESEEKEIVLQQYRQILNAIDFPFQILQQSRIVDISDYLSQLEGFASTEKNPLIKKQIEFYTEYLIDLIRDRSVLTKKFYFVVPYDEAKENQNKNNWYAQKQKQKEKEAQKNKKRKGKSFEEEEIDIYAEEKSFEKARKMLFARATMIERAFRRFDISPNILDDKELLELFYTVYNKDRSVIQSLRNANINDYTSIRVKAKRRNKNEV